MEKEELIKIISEEFGVKEEAIYAHDKSGQASLARGYAIYLLHYDLKQYASVIANTFKISRRAIYWNCNKIAFLIKQKTYAQHMRNIKARLGIEE